ncbi:MAG TPA: DUF4160 domain-containing protein [Caulobacterales bacterium]|jgi:hypothetical protein|nr:DUF4160 domain-containing protein [Caulobacterales bacterium]
MPTISIFFGIVVQMYWRDHPPPHIHAFYGGAEALIAIESGEVIGGRLPPAALRLVRAWIEDRRDLLQANWERAMLREPLEQVPGADET